MKITKLNTDVSHHDRPVLSLAAQLRRCGHLLKQSLQSGFLTIMCCLLINTVHAQEGGAATINLENADIRQLINTVSRATGKNFIIDPRVKAKVTVVSSKAMEKEELYEVFLSILQVHGFSAVPGDGIIKIVPDVNAKQGAVPTGSTAGSYAGTDQLITQVISLENVAANQLVPILRPLVPQQGHLAAYAPSNVLVVTDRAINIKRLAQVIKRIDRPDSDDIEVVKLKYASAAEIVRIITQLQQKTPQGGANLPGQSSVIADDRTNVILLRGDRAARSKVRKIVAQLDTPLDSAGGNTKVIFLKYADATEMVSILQGVSANVVDPENQQPGGNNNANRRRSNRPEVDIQADENNNALIITASQAIIRQLESIIYQLDIQRAQVLIEAVIAEVSLDLAKELGAQFITRDQDGDGVIGGSLFSQSLDLAAFAAGTGGSPGDGLTLGIGDETGNRQFGFVLRALNGDAATNILSTPTLVTLDNVEAEIVFGQNVPFVTGSFSNTGASSGATNPFQTIEREDVGITLKVKPQINEGDAIRLEIEQEVSNIAESAASVSDVITNKRSIKTEVMVTDGQMIVLGGLIEDTFRDSVQKVPILGSIPILGHLFKSTRTTKLKTNLMVFIRPVILHSDEEIDYYSSRKYKLIQERQREAKVSKRGLIRKAVQELPEIEVLFTPMPEKKVKPADDALEAENFEASFDDN